MQGTVERSKTKGIHVRFEEVEELTNQRLRPLRRAGVYLFSHVKGASSLLSRLAAPSFAINTPPLCFRPVIG